MENTCTFIKNNNYVKAKVNNILSIIYNNDLITSCCLKYTKIIFSHWLIMEIEAFEQTLSLHRDGDGGFVKIAVIGTVAYNFIK